MHIAAIFPSIMYWRQPFDVVGSRRAVHATPTTAWAHMITFKLYYSDMRTSTWTPTQSQIFITFNNRQTRHPYSSVDYQWQREAGSAMLWRSPARPHARRSPHGLRAVQRPLLAPTNYTLAYLIILSKTIVEEIIQIAELADWTIRVELKMVSAGFRCQCTAEGQSSSSLFIVL